jgi:hypothetical protein
MGRLNEIGFKYANNTSSSAAVFMKNPPKGHYKTILVVNIEAVNIYKRSFLCEPNCSDN